MTGQVKSKRPKVLPTVATQQLPSTSAAASTSATEEKKGPQTRENTAAKATAKAQADAFELYSRRDDIQSRDPELRPMAYAWPNSTQHRFENLPDYLIDGSRGFKMSFVYSHDRKKSDFYRDVPVMPRQVFERETTTHVAYFHCERDDANGTRVVCANRPC